MCCEIIVLIVYFVAASRRKSARKRRESASMYLKEPASEATTLVPGATEDSNTTQEISEKTFENAAIGQEKKSGWSFADRWRRVKC